MKRWFIERNSQMNWDNPGRVIRVRWPFLRSWNNVLVDMMNIAAHTEGIKGTHVAVVQIHPLAPSAKRRGDVRFLRALEGVTFRNQTIHQDFIHLVSPKDVRRMAIDIAKATDQPQRDSFRASNITARAIARQVIEDALAMITAGSLAGQMGVEVDENQLVRKQRGILYEYRKRRDAT